MRLIIMAAALFGSTLPVHAEPVSTTAFFVSLGLSAAGAAVATFAVQIGVAAAFSALIATNVQGGRAKAAPAKYKGEFYEAASSEMIGFGRCEFGGLIVFGNTNGTERFRLYAHLKGPIDGIEDYYLSTNSVVTTPGSGAVGSHPYGGNVIINSYLGNGSETAWLPLLNNFPTLWTSAHKGIGIFQSLCQFSSGGYGSDAFQKMYASGVPQLTVLGRWSKVYDPRDAAQSVGTPGTWKWSENAILIAAWVLQQFPSFADDDIDWDDIEIQADLADTYGYTLAGVFPAENARSDVMRDILTSCGAEIYTTDTGKYSIRIIEENRPAEFTIDPEDIISIDRKFGPEGVERPNKARISFYSPERRYDVGDLNMESIGWANIAAEISRVGEQFKDYDFPFCNNYLQAQRIGRRVFAEERAPGGRLTTNKVGMLAWGRNVFQFTDPDSNEIIIAEIKGPPRVNPNGDGSHAVEIEYTQQPVLSDWSLEVKAAAPIENPEFNNPPTTGQPNAPVKAIHVQTASTNQVRIILGSNAHNEYEVVFRKFNAEGNPGLMIPMTNGGHVVAVSGQTLSYYHNEYLEGDLLFFRQRGRTNSPETDLSAWSQYLQIASLAGDNSTPSTPAISESNSVGDPDVSITISISTAFDLHLSSYRLEVATSSSGSTSGLTWETDETGIMDLPYSLTGFSRNITRGPAAEWKHYRLFLLTQNGTSSTSNIVSIEIPEEESPGP